MVDGALLVAGFLRESGKFNALSMQRVGFCVGLFLVGIFGTLEEDGIRSQDLFSPRCLELADYPDDVLMDCLCRFNLVGHERAIKLKEHIEFNRADATSFLLTIPVHLWGRVARKALDVNSLMLSYRLSTHFHESFKRGRSLPNSANDKPFDQVYMESGGSADAVRKYRSQQTEQALVVLRARFVKSVTPSDT